MAEITRRGFVAGALAAAAAPRARAAAGTTLRFVPHADLAIVDPYASGAYITRNFGYMVYDTLFALDNKLKPQPQMVARWTVGNDGLTWEFTLRDGLAFHDGAPVRGADAAASIKRWGARNDSYGQSLLAAAQTIEATGDNSFRIALKTPFPVLDALGTLTAPTPFILPERLAKTDPYTRITEIVGSGPFKFVKAEWEPGHRVVYERNAAYVSRREPPLWTSGGKVVKVGRVEWLYIPDPVTALNALTGGEIDYWENVPNDYAPGLAKDPDIRMALYPGNIGTVRFNQLYPPFDNVKMRQAVLAVVNQRDYMAAMAGDPGNWRICPSVYACAWGQPDPPGGEALAGPRDLDTAKKLVAEAGYRGEKIVLLDPADIPQLHAEALVTNDVLKRLGLNIDLITAEWGTVVKRVNTKEPPDKGGWNVLVTSFAAHDMINPATNRMLRTNGGAAPPGWPTDKTLEDLRDQWFRAPDEASRTALARKIQERAFEIVPYIPTGEYRTRGAYRAAITGTFEAPFSLLWNLEKPG